MRVYGVGGMEREGGTEGGTGREWMRNDKGPEEVKGYHLLGIRKNEHANFTSHYVLWKTNFVETY